MTSALVWFRRDLRDYDHAALHHALKFSKRVFCAFVFDTDILDQLRNRADRRVDFIWHSVNELRLALENLGGGLMVLHGQAQSEIPKLAERLGVNAVFTNHDYEPAAIARDDAVASGLRNAGIEFHTFKDQVVFERDEVMTQEGRPYSVFTPYKNAWLKRLQSADMAPCDIGSYRGSFAAHESGPMPELFQLGFRSTPAKIAAGMSGASGLIEDFRDRIRKYKDTRDYPAIKGPSYLSTHLRFGTTSIRALVRIAIEEGGAGAETWLSELIWRDFYFMVLHHHPQIAAGRAFKPAFDAIKWPGEEVHFQAWCAGLTGYPLVDAAMRQLNQTGYMHNRLRMVAASFLVKDLLVDWRKGEAYFADQLLDFDLAANNGGWQWAASTGCDAQPWFRIFNPVTQSEKFDAEGKFIRKYVPELAACNNKEIHAPWKIPLQRQENLGLLIGRDYPVPIVDHAVMRERALALYKNAV